MRLIILLLCLPLAVDADPCAKTAFIDGIAVDQAGHGIAGVGVHVEPVDHIAGASAMTGSDGRFHIACIHPGDAYIEAGNEILATTPQDITLTADKSTRVRFEMVATIIAGVALMPDGAPATQATITVHGPIDGANNVESDLAVDASGHFSVRALPPGRYHLEAKVGKRVVQTVVTTSEDKLQIQI